MAGRSPSSAAKKVSEKNLTASELAKALKLATQQADALEKECKDLKELASRLKEERDKLCNRLKEKEDDNREIIELKRKICELECEKLKAKTDADVYEKRIKALEGRLLIQNLEKVASGKLSTTKTIAGKRKASEETSDSSSDSDGEEFPIDDSADSSSSSSVA